MRSVTRVLLVLPAGLHFCKDNYLQFCVGALYSHRPLICIMHFCKCCSHGFVQTMFCAESVSDRHAFEDGGAIVRVQFKLCVQ